MPRPNLSARPRFKRCPVGRYSATSGTSASVTACRISICRVTPMPLIAPASADFIRKLAHGAADDLLSLLFRRALARCWLHRR